MQSSAIFSDDRRYRYVLRRRWSDWPGKFVVIGLNPSTADEATDDPTIRRLTAFATREKCGQLVMLNLFALIATDPSALRHAPDRIGEDNDRYLQHHCYFDCTADTMIVAAWGAHGAKWPSRVGAVLELLSRPIYCFGLSKDGSPRHPLYLPRDARLVNYEHELVMRRRSRTASTP